ncbi:hypothetical protein C8F04DRAFT_388256 [Mycena alexandri]|uniref:Mucoidy inhibitor A n=1 Tax=Mycena alexandri TaxID=1745969 RepID=A0AAD6X7P4_9AGAR|nr:hypothetical protein C8F04DRAFT_388256 [Mycena alexandri]
MATDNPPAFEPTSIELQSVADSTITAVSLYSTRAEVTRLFKFTVQTGQNQVNISGLPNVLEAESLKVEGRGAATIHDVTLSMAEKLRSRSSPRLQELLIMQEGKADDLARCQQALSSVKQYLGSLTVQHLAPSQLEEVLQQSETTGARLDARKVELMRELQRISADIESERAQIEISPGQNKLRNKAAIGVFAESAGDVEIALVYAVPFASWTAFYDIRVNMDTKESPVTIMYKAAVQQNTGESWENVPLQLETATPTFGIDVPLLVPWNLDIYQPPPTVIVPVPTRAHYSGAPVIIQSRSHSRRSRSRSRHRRHSVSSSSDAPMPIPMRIVESAVTSTGNVSATFRVPGLVSIPCDGAAHNFTIVELHPQAAMSWVAVPRREAKTHLTAHITNVSEYTLLSGAANVYVDGSFIARSAVPTVSPQENFDCPLGLDPSIRISYHPVAKKLSQSGFYKKNAMHVFTQRITIHNTKNVAVEQVKIVDQIPSSRNAQIKVKLVQPALALDEDTVKRAEVRKTDAAVKVGAGIVARWDGGDEADRRVSWTCAVPAQGKINLSLEWTVTVSPANAQVIGL